MKKITYILIAILTATVISVSGAFVFYARFITTCETLTFSLDVTANFKTTFNTNGGTIISPDHTDDIWIALGSDSVVKKCEAGKPVGLYPTVIKEGYHSTASGHLSGYTLLEYIKSTGTQWIDTGYTLTSNTVKFDLDFSQTSLSNGQSLFGSEAPNPKGGRLFTGVPYGPTAAMYIGTSENLAILGRSLDNTGKRCHFILETDGKQHVTITYDGINHTGTYSGELYKAKSAGLLNNTGSTNQTTSATVYEFKIYDNGILVRDMVPAMRSNPEAVGMLDLVNNHFYENAGSGSFIAGPSLNPIMPAHDFTIDINWIPDTHTVTLDAADTPQYPATGMPKSGNITVTYDNTFAELPDLTRYGYDFLGWFDEGGTEYTKDKTVKLTGDITLKARWNPKNVNVNFNPVGGTIPESGEAIWQVNPDGTADKTVTFLSTYGELPVPVKPGYRFVCWQSDSDYVPLEYIESNANNQWIDTDYKLTSEKIKIELKFSQTSTTTKQSLFGSESPAPRFFTGVPYGINAALYIGSNTALTSISGNLDATGAIRDFVLETDGNQGYSVTYNDNTVKGSYSGLLYKEKSVGLLNNTGQANQYTAAKVYSFKITDNGTVVRDMVPCMKISTSEIGMYDNCSRRFFVSANPNKIPFIAGNPLENAVIDSSTTVISGEDHKVKAVWESLPVLMLNYNYNKKKNLLIVPQESE